MLALAIMLALSFVAVGSSQAKQPETETPQTYRNVDLDAFIAEEQPMEAGKKTLVPPSRVSFDAKLMRQPEKIDISYLYVVFNVMKVNPPPVVSHRMFVQSPKGKIIPVYVEDAAVPVINKLLKVDETARFKGYHVYNYSKGPAIVVQTFE